MKLYISIACLCATLTASAQQIIPLSYHQYMEKVAEGNLEYAAERLNVNVSEAEVTAAKVFNDPNLAVSYYNNENNNLQMGEGVEVELSKTFSFGKRGAGIALARSESELTKALLADYFRNLRAEATVSYLEALKQYELYKVKENAYETIRQLAESDSVRYRLGKIMEIDATQSRLEAGILHNELLQADAELQNAFSNLNLLTGTLAHDTLFQPEAVLRISPREFVMADLLSNAVENRADLVAALKNKEVASRALKVARRDRNTDVDLSIAVSRNARVHNEEAPAPPFTGVTAGVAIPLKFSNFNKGTVRAARFREQQAETQYQQALLQVQTEVMQAYRSYQSFSKQVEHYENGMLSQAREVIDGKIYSYNRGEVSLLEVLDAQRTYDDVQAQYIETLFNHSTALVELEKSAGVWDVEL
ncbi:TolC family protein [Parabacteroides acidifaciens]|uniref:TolC family protein n=1 Tax=Parabacteroides acidifaciens TaxID=2290935 RepID=A0A3D8HBC8_9BACT|nr:TolC family protein [Parabacteroides acidifaciens]MBC8602964.1 TolC family protein [Parabacteroides acidifaciens]RDU48295.1 TolC family protein [Parabacteroides acidifaciens]